MLIKQNAYFFGDLLRIICTEARDLFFEDIQFLNKKIPINYFHTENQLHIHRYY